MDRKRHHHRHPEMKSVFLIIEKKKKKTKMKIQKVHQAISRRLHERRVIATNFGMKSISSSNLRIDKKERMRLLHRDQQHRRLSLCTVSFEEY